MQKTKKDWETLRDTGILGAYQPEEVSLQELPSGGSSPCFWIQSSGSTRASWCASGRW